jgi:cytochrome P450
LFISDPLIIKELYTTHNKFFDKDPSVYDVTTQLIGRSILFSNTTEEWRQRRTALAPTFYKGKMLGMISIVKDEVRDMCDKWQYKSEIQNKGGSFEVDFVQETSALYSRIMLKCAIGESLEDSQIDFYEDGVNKPRNVAYAIRDVLGQCIDRMTSPHILLSKTLKQYYITPFERDNLANCKALRRLFQSFVDKRKDLMKNNPKEADKKQDLLSILLTDELFKNDNEMIIDETLTFFLAGS